MSGSAATDTSGKCCNAASNSCLPLKISSGLALLMQGEEASAEGYKMFQIAQEIFAHPESLWLRSMNLKRQKWRETGLKSQETGIFLAKSEIKEMQMPSNTLIIHFAGSSFHSWYCGCQKGAFSFLCLMRGKTSAFSAWTHLKNATLPRSCCQSTIPSTRSSRMYGKLD